MAPRLIRRLAGRKTNPDSLSENRGFFRPFCPCPLFSDAPGHPGGAQALYVGFAETERVVYFRMALDDEA